MRTAIRFALALYPRWWRRRYEREMEALLEESGAGWGAAFDLARGALAVHMGYLGGRIRLSGQQVALSVGRNTLGFGAFVLVSQVAILAGPTTGPRFMACALAAVVSYKLRASLMMTLLVALTTFYGTHLIFPAAYAATGLSERPIEFARIAISLSVATVVWWTVHRRRARAAA